MSENSIKQDSHTITVNDEGGISKDSSTRSLTTSKSRLSLHGIEIPSTLFPESWRIKANQIKIKWPFPLILLVDICGNRDLDLNSPRTEIIMSEKWMDFEEELAFIICTGIANSVTKDYWNELKAILVGDTTNDHFLKGLNKVIVE